MLEFTVPDPTPRDEVETHSGGTPFPFVLKIYPFVLGDNGRYAEIVEYNISPITAGVTFPPRPPLVTGNTPVVSEIAMARDDVAIHDGAAVPFDFKIVPAVPAARLS